MKHLFYFIGFIFIVYELMWIASPVEFSRKSLRLSELIKEFREKTWKDYSEEYRNLLLGSLMKLPLMLYPIAGLFTFNWIIFLIFLLWNFFIGLVARPFRSVKHLYIYSGIMWVNSIVGLFVATFTILNSYHLKIDPLPLLNQFIQTNW